MKANLIWYVPLTLFVLGFVLVINGSTDFRYLQLLAHRWIWGALLSPSTYVFIVSLFGTIVYPLINLASIPKFFNVGASAYNRRYQLTLLAVVMIVVFSFLFELIVWGSFPLEFDSHGVGRLRLIPFLPWPDRPF